MTVCLRLMVLVLFTLYGCANLTTEPYGHVAKDSVKVSPEIDKIFLPPGAPSISQGYKPEDPNSGYGQRNKSAHEGIDVLAHSGKPVLAAADGTVSSSFFEPLYGNQIVIAHGQNDDGLYYKTKYFHLQHRFVQAGDAVVRGQQIGTLGMTGLLSAGFSHLHFEVRTSPEADTRLTDPVHPHKYWIDGPGIVTCFDKDRDYPVRPFRTTYPVPCNGVRWKDWGAN